MEITRTMIYAEVREEIIPIKWKDVFFIRKTPGCMMEVVLNNRRRYFTDDAFSAVKNRVIEIHPDATEVPGAKILVPKHSQKKLSWLSECFLVSGRDDLPEWLKKGHESDLKRMQKTEIGMQYLLSSGHFPGEQRVEMIIRQFCRNNHTLLLSRLYGIVSTLIDGDEGQKKKGYDILIRMAENSPYGAYLVMTSGLLRKEDPLFERIANIAYINPHPYLIDMFRKISGNSGSIWVSRNNTVFSKSGWSFPDIHIYADEVLKYRDMVEKAVLTRGSLDQLTAFYGNVFCMHGNDDPADKVRKRCSRVLGRIAGKASGKKLADAMLNIISLRKKRDARGDQMIKNLSDRAFKSQDTLEIYHFWEQLANLIDTKFLDPKLQESLLEEGMKKANKGRKYWYFHMCADLLLDPDFWEKGIITQALRELSRGNVRNSVYSFHARVIDLARSSGYTRRMNKKVFIAICMDVAKYGNRVMAKRLAKIPHAILNPSVFKALAENLYRLGEFKALENMRNLYIRNIGKYPETE